MEICILFGLIIIVGVLLKKEEVLAESFWWHTFDGMRYSTARLYKYSFFNLWTIEIDNDEYKNPKEHPNWARFLEKVEDAKK